MNKREFTSNDYTKYEQEEIIFELKYPDYPAPQNEPFRTLLISESIEKQKRYFTNRRK